MLPLPLCSVILGSLLNVSELQVKANTKLSNCCRKQKPYVKWGPGGLVYGGYSLNGRGIFSNN